MTIKADKLQELLDEVEAYEKDLDAWITFLSLPTRCRDSKGNVLRLYPISAKIRMLKGALTTHNLLNEEVEDEDMENTER